MEYIPVSRVSGGQLLVQLTSAPVPPSVCVCACVYDGVAVAARTVVRPSGVRRVCL